MLFSENIGSGSGQVSCCLTGESTALFKIDCLPGEYCTGISCSSSCVKLIEAFNFVGDFSDLFRYLVNEAN